MLQVKSSFTPDTKRKHLYFFPVSCSACEDLDPQRIRPQYSDQIVHRGSQIWGQSQGRLGSRNGGPVPLHLPLKSLKGKKHGTCVVVVARVFPWIRTRVLFAR